MKKIINALRFSTYAKEIEGYGYQYSFKKYMKHLAIGAIAIIIIGGLLYMHTSEIIAVAALMAMLLPAIMMFHFRFMYEADRYEEVSVYMENMMSAFKRTPKILVALKETELTASGKMKSLIHEVEEKLKAGKDYEEALKVISDEYQCPRLDALHDFIIRVELQGGEYVKSLDVLMNDLLNWNEITYQMQKERKKHMNMIIAFSGMIIAVVILMLRNINMLRDLVDIADSTFYQCTSLVFLCAFIILYLLAQKGMTTSWISESNTLKKKDIDRYFHDIECYEPITAKKKNMKKCILFVVFAAIGIYMKNMVIVIGSVVCIALFQNAAERHIQFCKKKLSREIEKVFPSWMRGIQLGLQTQNIYMALVNSLDNAPYVLRGELEKTLLAINESPESIQSYDVFLKDFPLREVKSVFKQLYALDQFATNETKYASQIDDMIARNSELAIKSEKMANEDAMSMFTLYQIMPTLFGAVKLLCDLWVFINMFMAATTL